MDSRIVRNGYRAAHSPYKIGKYIQRKLYKTVFGSIYSPILTREDIKTYSHGRYDEYDKPEKYNISVEKKNDADVVKEAINRWSDYLPNNRIIGDLSEGEVSAEHSYTVHNHAPFLASIKNAVVYSPYGLIRTQDDKFPTEIRGSSESWAKDLFARSLQDWGIIQTIYTTRNENESATDHVDVAATMLNARSVPDRMAYGHWLLEAIPKLRGIKEYAERYDKHPIIFVDPHIAEWQRKLILASGIDRKHLVQWNNGPTRVDEFVIPKWGKNEYCKSDLEWVSKNIKKNIDYEKYKGNFSTHIYLTRENFDSRNIVNRTGIMSLLKEYGFEKRDPSKMSIQEQVALFEQGDIFIGPNGSAFANMIFSPGATTIQIYPPEFLKMRLYEVNCIMGHQTNILLGDEKTSGHGHNANFTISTDKIEELLLELDSNNKQ